VSIDIDILKLCNQLYRVFYNQLKCLGVIAVNN
jgi:hypothetical protein